MFPYSFAMRVAHRAAPGKLPTRNLTLWNLWITRLPFIGIAFSLAAFPAPIVAQLTPEPTLPKKGVYACSPQYFAGQISKAKAAIEVADWTMATALRDIGEGASQCADKYRNPHYDLLKAYFYFQAARLDMREQPPSFGDARTLYRVAKDALKRTEDYILNSTDEKMFAGITALGNVALSEVAAGAPGVPMAATHPAPVSIDSCALQPHFDSPSIIPSASYFDVGIGFHATSQPVNMIEFLFWFQDSFGDRQGTVYSGISNGTFSPGIEIAPRRGLVGYLGRGMHPNEAVWPLYAGGKTGSAECAVYKVRFPSGEVWTDHTYDTALPIQLP
jgi:hypothetical protein